MVGSKVLVSGKILLVLSWMSFMVLIHYLADSNILNDFFPWKKALAINDVVGHFVLVGTLGFFLAFIAKSKYTLGPIKVFKVVVVFMVIVSIEETTQLFRVNRSFSFADMGANVFGLLVFSKIGEFVNSWGKNKKE